MTPDEYFQFHKSVCDKARDLSVSKSNDYASPDRRPNDRLGIFHNFLHSERLGLCTVEQGVMVRVSDKLARISNLIDPQHKQAVKDETINDSVMDTINYLCLLLAYREAKK
jgi:hypothetical protein